MIEREVVFEIDGMSHVFEATLEIVDIPRARRGIPRFTRLAPIHDAKAHRFVEARDAIVIGGEKYIADFEQSARFLLIRDVFCQSTEHTRHERRAHRAMFDAHRIGHFERLRLASIGGKIELLRIVRVHERIVHALI